MALTETTFGPPLGSSRERLDTRESEVLDAVANNGPLLVPGGNFLLEAQYDRLGPDLLLSGNGQSVFIRGYFTHSDAPDLYAGDGGSVVYGSSVLRLVGPLTPGQFAQVEDGSVVGTAAIGIVDIAQGRVLLSRTDGNNVLAEAGTEIFFGDVVETDPGASVGITFVDNSTFALGESGRMVIDEFVFEPAEGLGQSVFNVLKGVFSFVSGEIAEGSDDAMTVNTPVLSIGVRGTTVAGRAAAEGSENTVTLLPDAGGSVGAIAVSNQAGVQVMSQPFATTTVTSLFESPPIPTTLATSEIQDLYGNIAQALPDAPLRREQEGGADRGEDQSDHQQGQSEQQIEEEQSEAEDQDATEGGDVDEETGDLQEGEDLEEGSEIFDGEEQGLADGEAPTAQEGSLEERQGPEGNIEEFSAVSDAEDASYDETASGPDDQETLDEFEEREPRRFDTARDAFDDALAEGATEEEAFAEAARAMGRTEEESLVAQEAYAQALSEGLSEREAIWQAENAVMDEFGADFRGPGEEQIGAARDALTDAIEGGATTEQALRSVLSSDSTWEEVDAAREATWQSFDEAWQGGDTSTFAKYVEESGVGGQGMDSFMDVLGEGGSADDAWRIAETQYMADRLGDRAKINQDGHIEVDWSDGFEFDWLGNSLWAQGFDPHLAARAKVQETFNEILISQNLSEGTISRFGETLDLTTGDDKLEGSDAKDSQFVASQGSTLGGTDTVNGGDGQNEMSFTELDNILMSFDFGTDIGTYSTSDGTITGSITLLNIDQFFVDDGGEDKQRLSLEIDSGIGVVLSGTSSANTINLTADQSFGSGSTQVTLDADASAFFGSIIFGKAGNDVITSSQGEDLIFGGSGDDTINSGAETDTIQAGTGDDTVVISQTSDVKDGDDYEEISGGDNGNTGDSLQIGDSNTTSSQLEFILGDQTTFNGVSLSGFENLTFFKDNTTLQAFEELFVQFDTIKAVGGTALSSFDADSDGVGVTLVGAGSTLNLSTISTVSDVVTNLSAKKTEFDNGYNITDADDSIGRTLTGSAKNDTLRGLGGNDTFVMGGGRDTLIGGAGADTFKIAADSDITSGVEISGGAGTDTLSISSTSVTELNFPDNNVSFATLETFNITGGAAGGVAVSIGARDLANLTTVTADGTADSLKIFSRNGENNVDLLGKTITDVETISMTEASFQQRMEINGDTTFTGVTTITGTVGSDNTADDTVDFNGDRNFSGFTFTNVDALRLQDGDSSQQTISLSSTSSLGLAQVQNFAAGSASTADIFDYTSAVKSGDGTSVGAGTNLTLSTASSGSSSVTAISDNSTGLVKFEDSDLSTLGIDLDSSTSAAILDGVETLLESRDAGTQLTGSSTQVTQGGTNTDMLLVFFEGGSEGSEAVVVRYQETGTSSNNSAADYNDELSIVAIFDGEFDIVNANIV